MERTPPHWLLSLTAVFCCVSSRGGCSALHRHSTNGVSLTVSPSTSQQFLGRSLSLSCEEQSSSAGWKVWRATAARGKNKCGSGGEWWEAFDSSCVIGALLPWDSGEYWCESGEGERSDTVNITVIGGPVILESPARPVTEGDAVTLRCARRETSPDLSAHFYKDGSHVRTESTGEMTIRSISKSDEGLYRCDTSGLGGSAPSWVAVAGIRKSNLSSSVAPLLLSTAPPLPPPSHLLEMCVRLLCAATLLTVLVGGLWCHRRRIRRKHNGGDPTEGAPARPQAWARRPRGDKREGSAGSLTEVLSGLGPGDGCEGDENAFAFYPGKCQ